MSDLVFLGVLAVYGGLLALDALAPARRFPRIRFWRLKGLAFFLLFLVLSTVAPFLWDGFLGEHRLVDVTGLGTWAGAAVGFLALQLGVYLWHRALHRVPFLWRWFHQMHHSAERVDVYGAFYFSPLDMIGFTLLGSLVLVWALGVTPEAAVLVNGAATFCSIFQHANLRTPRWLGYLLQRPENHAVHHERGVHGFNYGDIPLFDILFGTFRNPERWAGEAGFWDGASRRIGQMLLGRDAARPS